MFTGIVAAVGRIEAVKALGTSDAAGVRLTVDAGALDLGDIANSWRHYEQSRAAAAQSGSTTYESHAAAEQAFVLIAA